MTALTAKLKKPSRAARAFQLRIPADVVREIDRRCTAHAQSRSVIIVAALRRVFEIAEPDVLSAVKDGTKK